MAGDLTLRFLWEASASGLLRTLGPDPFETKDLLHLKHHLAYLRQERYIRYSQREWITSLVTQLCMAIGNRDRYSAVNQDMMRILTYLRELDLPEIENTTGKGHDGITDLWRRVFGDPDEMDRLQAERDAAFGIGESEEARLVRERLEYVQKNLFR